MNSVGVVSSRHPGKLILEEQGIVLSSLPLKTQGDRRRRNAAIKASSYLIDSRRQAQTDRSHQGVLIPQGCHSPEAVLYTNRRKLLPVPLIIRHELSGSHGHAARMELKIFSFNGEQSHEYTHTYEHTHKSTRIDDLTVIRTTLTTLS